MVAKPPPYIEAITQKHATKIAKDFQPAATDASTYMTMPSKKKIRYVGRRPSLSDDDAQTKRPAMLNSEINPTNPAPMATAPFKRSGFCLSSAKPMSG